MGRSELSQAHPLIPDLRALLRKSIDDEMVIKSALKESRYIVVDISQKKPPIAELMEAN